MAKPVKRKTTGTREQRDEQRAEQREANSRAYRERGRDVDHNDLMPEPIPLPTGLPRNCEPSKEHLDAVLDYVASGGTVKRACRELGIAESTARKYLRRDRPVEFAAARQLQAEAWGDTLIELSGAKINYADDGASVEVQHLKQRVDTLRWLMARYAVGTYGDKVTLAGDPENPLHTAGDPDSILKALEKRGIHLKYEGSGR